MNLINREILTNGEEACQRERSMGSLDFLVDTPRKVCDKTLIA